MIIHFTTALTPGRVVIDGKFKLVGVARTDLRAGKTIERSV